MIFFYKLCFKNRQIQLFKFIGDTIEHLLELYFPNLIGKDNLYMYGVYSE